MMVPWTVDLFFWMLSFFLGGVCWHFGICQSYIRERDAAFKANKIVRAERDALREANRSCDSTYSQRAEELRNARSERDDLRARNVDLAGRLGVVESEADRLRDDLAAASLDLKAAVDENGRLEHELEKATRWADESNQTRAASNIVNRAALQSAANGLRALAIQLDDARVACKGPDKPSPPAAAASPPTGAHAWRQWEATLTPAERDDIDRMGML